ncbi:hypothetical protein AGMMS4957_00080 [Bacteroidia bacterium]|nr:hypothetical protein AGMMS4957_00080 [Bacteroidia bacterium]
MKKKVWIMGSVVAASCFLVTACDEKDDKSVTGIVVTANKPVNALAVGDEVTLTADITPAGATEAIKWVSEESDYVSIVGNGTTATIYARWSVTGAQVYATNQAGVVVSNKIDVTVKPGDYAALLVGNYSGKGALSGPPPFNDPNASVSVAIERVDSGKVNMNFVTSGTVISGLPLFPEGTPDEYRVLPIAAENVTLGPPPSDAENGIIGLTGETVAIEGLSGLWFTITGTFNVNTKTLSLKLTDGGTGTDKPEAELINITDIVLTK